MHKSVEIKNNGNRSILLVGDDVLMVLTKDYIYSRPKYSILWITSTVIICCLSAYFILFTLGLIIIGARDASGIARSASGSVFAFIGLFV